MDPIVSTTEDRTNNNNNNSNNNNNNNNSAPESTLNASTDIVDFKRNETTVVVNDFERRVIDEEKIRDGFINPDDVTPMTRTWVHNVRTEEETDAVTRRRSMKPSNYAARKTVAQGMMDIALLTSNANQLRNLIEYQRRSTTFWFVMILIVASLILQIFVGVSLIFKGRYDSKRKDKAAAARVNMWLMSSVFMITIINVFIAAFSTGPGPSVA